MKSHHNGTYMIFNSILIEGESEREEKERSRKEKVKKESKREKRRQRGRSRRIRSYIAGIVSGLSSMTYKATQHSARIGRAPASCRVGHKPTVVSGVMPTHKGLLGDGGDKKADSHRPHTAAAVLLHATR